MEDEAKVGGQGQITITVGGITYTQEEWRQKLMLDALLRIEELLKKLVDRPHGP